MPPRLIILLLFFASGAAALVYQVLWVRELSLLFGSTAEAAAVTLAVFFAGIAGGGAWFGRRAASWRHPLAGFGWLEIGVAVAALSHFVLLDAYHALYPALHAYGADHPILETLAKILITATLLLPASLLMGGTLPAMGQYLVRDPDRLGEVGSLLYFVNTAGAACGAFAAGFILPLLLGFSNAYLLAVGVDLLVGATAIMLARRWPIAKPTAPPPPRPGEPQDLPPLLIAAAAISGFATLAAEVIWTRMFAQVLQNSAYTYALVLVTFLLALAAGSALANRLCRLQNLQPEWVLAGLAVSGGLVLTAAPGLFHLVTDGLGYVGSGRGWGGYLLAVVTTAALTMFLPVMVLGTLLPWLLRTAQQSRLGAGETIGRLIAWNTGASIFGALAAGFLLLPMLGSAQSMALLGAAYFGLAGMILLARRRPAWAAAAVVVAVAVPVFHFGDLQRLRLDTERGEQLLAFVEGRQANVAVVERDGHRLIRVDNYYVLGGTGALDSERNQSLVPLLTHPEPRSLFYLGMGTGITAGAGLLFPVDRVVVCELLPEVVTLAREHFGDWTLDLFEDDRVQIHAEDGRNCLRRSTERFDLIIADLFTPWKAGTGNLYTREHYATASHRLQPGGAYVQWVPMYQVTRREFGIITRTMMEVFPQVVLWRGDLIPQRSIVALVGYNEPQPLDPDAAVTHGRRLAGNPDLPADLLSAVSLRFYGGNASASGLFDDLPVNTDDRPLIEYEAPRSQRRVQAGQDSFLTGHHAALLYEDLLRAVPPDRDPYLTALKAAQIGYVQAGRSYYHYAVLSRLGRTELAEQFLQEFNELSPFEAHLPPPPPETLSDWEGG